MSITLEQDLQIRQLFARYAHAIDSGDGETWSSCYTTDGVYWSSTFGTREGRPALAAFAQQHFAEWQEKGIITQHWINQSKLVEEGDAILGRTYVLLYGTRPDGPPRAMLQTTYVDRLVLEDGAYKLARRESHAANSLTLPA